MELSCCNLSCLQDLLVCDGRLLIEQKEEEHLEARTEELVALTL